jgi:hypothetical protein
MNKTKKNSQCPLIADLVLTSLQFRTRALGVNSILIGLTMRKEFIFEK